MSSIFKRVSVRKYSAKEVSCENIEMIVKAGMAAPSAGNQQPWEIYVVRNKSKLKTLSEISPYATFINESPVTFLVAYREDARILDKAVQDCSAAAQNMLLMMEELGLGGCWVGVAPTQEKMDYVSKTLDIPSNILPFALLSCGYPAGENKPKDKFNPERVHYID